MELKYLEEQIEQHGRALEAFGPIMTSLVQLVDSRRSIAQAENIRRLTYIVLGFIPLTFVSGTRGKVFLGLLHSSPSTCGKFTSRGHAGPGGFSTVCPTHNAVEEMKRLYSQDLGQLTLIHGRVCRD